MLARKILEPHYRDWNRKWGAPFGHRPAELPWYQRYLRPLRNVPDEFQRRGMFGFQPNNDTRRFEYPWAFFSSQLEPGMKVLEIGGGLSGFQFVLSRLGLDVTNVDPGMESLNWPVSEEFIANANRAFGTSVKLVKKTFGAAELEDATFDRVFSISVLEHFHKNELDPAMRKIRQILKPGGVCVMTVDLFLDLHPFSDKTQNTYGTNVSIRDLVEESGMRLIHGDPRELFGYTEFDPRVILGNLPEYLIGGGYPVLIQTLILRRS